MDVAPEQRAYEQSWIVHLAAIELENIPQQLVRIGFLKELWVTLEQAWRDEACQFW